MKYNVWEVIIDETSDDYETSLHPLCVDDTSQRDISRWNIHRSIKLCLSLKVGNNT